MRSFRPSRGSLIELNPVFSDPVLLADRVYVGLKHRILTGAMPPGEKIIERNVAVELSASRTPVREALNRLSLEGLVVLKPYCGYLVAPLDLESFHQLCEMRRVIESEVAALAAERAEPEDVNRLWRLTTRQIKPGTRRTNTRILRANSLFHLTLVRCARNKFLEGVVMSGLDQEQRPLHLSLNLGVYYAVEQAEHRAVVRAVRARDPKGARLMMSRHLERAAQVAVKALTAGGLFK